MFHDHVSRICRIFAVYEALYHITVVELIVSSINNFKTTGGGHAMHERQAILWTTVVISPCNIHFVWRTRTS